MPHLQDILRGPSVRTSHQMEDLSSPGKSDLLALLRFISHTLTVIRLSSADKSIRVWDISTRTSVSTIHDAGGEVWSVSWRPSPPAHGSPGSFVSGGEDGQVKWWRGAGAG